MAQARSNIVLTGFMGTGKTAVGQALATRLRMNFVDTDALIEAQHGPIPTIFADHGEEVFRDIERNVVAQVAQSQGIVVATGGGTMLDPANAQALATSGLVYTLTAEADEIVRRVSGDGNPTRPLLEGGQPRERVSQLLAERAPVYRQFPQIRTDGRETHAIANEIANDAANRGAVVLGPEPREDGSSRSPALAFFVGGFLLVGLVGIVALLLTRGGDEGRRDARDLAGPSSIVPDGAPPGDEYIDIVLVMDASPGAARAIQDWFGGGFEPGFGGEELVEDSVVHVATVGSRFGDLDSYRWETITRWPGQPQERLRCSGEIGGFGGGGQSCTPVQFAEGPMVNWGGTGNGRQWITTISVSGAPDEAVWMTTELQTGWTVVSSVVGGYGYTEFDEFEGQPRQVTLYDTELNEVWSERMF